VCVCVCVPLAFGPVAGPGVLESTGQAGQDPNHHHAVNAQRMRTNASSTSGSGDPGTSSSVLVLTEVHADVRGPQVPYEGTCAICGHRCHQLQRQFLVSWCPVRQARLARHHWHHHWFHPIDTQMHVLLMQGVLFDYAMANTTSSSVVFGKPKRLGAPAVAGHPEQRCPGILIIPANSSKAACAILCKGISQVTPIF